MRDELEKFYEEYIKNSVMLPYFITRQFMVDDFMAHRGCVGEVISPDLIEGYTGAEYIVDKNENKGFWELLPATEGANGYVYLMGEWIEINSK